MAERFARLFSDVLAAVERDAPRCADGTRRALEGLTLDLTVNDERTHLEVERARWSLDRTRADTHASDVDVRTTAHTISAIVGGELELLPALETGALIVRADAARAGALFDAFACLVEGCVRSPEGPSLLRRLHQLASAQGM